MSCLLCKGDMVDGTTTDVTDLKTCVIVIKNVPCLKCDQCGKTSYTGKVVKVLEGIVDNLRDSLMEIAVINYSDKVA